MTCTFTVERGGIVTWQHFCCGAHRKKCLKALEETHSSSVRSNIITSEQQIGPEMMPDSMNMMSWRHIFTGKAKGFENWP